MNIYNVLGMYFVYLIVLTLYFIGPITYVSQCFDQLFLRFVLSYQY